MLRSKVGVPYLQHVVALLGNLDAHHGVVALGVNSPHRLAVLNVGALHLAQRQTLRSGHRMNSIRLVPLVHKHHHEILIVVAYSITVRHLRNLLARLLLYLVIHILRHRDAAACHLQEAMTVNILLGEQHAKVEPLAFLAFDVAIAHILHVVLALLAAPSHGECRRLAAVEVSLHILHVHPCPVNKQLVVALLVLLQHAHESIHLSLAALVLSLLLLLAKRAILVTAQLVRGSEAHRRIIVGLVITRSNQQRQVLDVLLLRLLLSVVTVHHIHNSGGVCRSSAENALQLLGNILHARCQQHRRNNCKDNFFHILFFI